MQFSENVQLISYEIGYAARLEGDEALTFDDGTSTSPEISPFALGNRNFFNQFSVAANTTISVTTVENDDPDLIQIKKFVVEVEETPEMDVQGNGLSVPDGDTTPSADDHTDFGTADVNGGTIERTFTVENTGTVDLNLTGAPVVEIDGPDADDFTVTQQPTSPVVPGGTADFTVQFAPGAAGLRQAAVSIDNDDADENPYTFDIQGTGEEAPPQDAPPPPTPSVINVTSAPTSASYSIGSVIEITVHFSVPVWVSGGTPLLVLKTGTAYYSSGSGTDTLTFLYTVTAGDDLAALDYWSQWALELNGGQIYSNQGIDADLDLSVPGEQGSLGYNTSLGVLGTLYPVYRLYNPGLLKHLFTTDENEMNHLVNNGWRDEGPAYYGYLPEQYDAASRQQKSTLRAVHRFYSEALTTHLFTIDENEKDYLIANAADVWRYEGVVFYIPATEKEGAVPVYRFYSEDLQVHLFTVDENEKNHLIDMAGDVWRFEGIAYYAYP
ncbi:choice-of-anchor D domain-containing protein [Desulfococcaceae bacterium HSG9]|nr:choice-of-anchor D domain-containing protein [Desulfococcaceae bacterium HSG9]